MGFPIGSFDDMYVRKTAEGERTKATPEGFVRQLETIGLTCPETEKEKLRGNIDKVLEGSAGYTTESYAITQPASQQDFSAGSVVAGARDLVSSLSSADLATRLFIGQLASTEPGTRDFVDALANHDSATHDFVAQVRESRPEALDFVGRVVNDEDSLGSLQSYVDALEVGGLAVVAQLSELGLSAVATGTWIPYDRIKYTQCLQNIQAPAGWKKLEDTLGSSFLGKREPKTGEWWSSDKKPYTSGEAFVRLFTEVAYRASATVSGGLAKTETEAELANRIKPSTIPDSDYNSGDQSMVIFLASGVDEEKKEVAGIGVLTVVYNIYIKDYRKKTKNDSDRWSTTKVRARCVQLTDPDDLNNYHRIATGSPCF
ncbi:lectin [Streptoalloteichus hindustanus]|uniref:Uncharacterized protein n=1 Tax=Streptoalloteichus hindustanus TaxID=2017 RepID=A0A1M5P232_STRHI|nr:lectin [Streptoalloteichus hindustanus]SHG95876.1 hypothetical protein SAMN05444320_11744 [Streptoalloteichus hindustanus]